MQREFFSCQSPNKTRGLDRAKNLALFKCTGDKVSF
jgi:hypothetical protein